MAAVDCLGVAGSVYHGVGLEAEAHGHVEGGREAVGNGEGYIGAPLEGCSFKAAGSGSGFVWGLGLSLGLKWFRVQWGSKKGGV